MKYSKTYHNIFSPSEHTNIKISDKVNALTDNEVRFRAAALERFHSDRAEVSGISV